MRFWYIYLFILLTVFGCGGDEQVPTVRLGHAPHDHHATLYIAASKGEYFKDKCGVYLEKVAYKKQYKLISGDKVVANISIDSSTGGIQLIKKLNEKILDVSFGGVPAMISVIDDGGKIKIVAPVMTEGASLVVSKDIPVNNWREFVEYAKKSEKPIKIGYKVDMSVQNLIFESALIFEKLSFSNNIASDGVDVTVINLHGPKNLIPSMKAGVIDGFVVMQPYPAISEHEGVAKIIAQLSSLPPEGQWKHHPCCSLAAGDEFLHNHHDIVDDLIKLFAAAGDFIENNPEESAVITSEWLMTPLAVERSSLPSIKFISEYNKSWNKGINFWIGALSARGELHGDVKRAFDQDRVNGLIYDNETYQKLSTGE